MCNHLNANNQREIFVNTIQEKLIGPGADVFGIEKEEELIAINPVKLYYSGILFSKAFSNPDAVTDADENIIEEIEMDNEGDNGGALQQNDDGFEEPAYKKEDKKDDTESANLRFQSFFLNKFGLAFAVNQNAEDVKLTFSYATYDKTLARKIKITEDEWSNLQESIDQLNLESTINNDFGTDCFALHNFIYENEILSFTYNPPENTSISDKKYIVIVKTAFAGNINLRNRFVYHLCAKNVYQRKPKTWKHTFNLVDRAVIEISDTSLQLYSKVFDNDGKKIIKLLVQNNCNAAEKSYKDCYFQVHLKVDSTQLTDYKKPFNSVIDEDYATVDYQYQNIKSFGKGIGCAVNWQEAESIETTFLPEEEIKNFSNLPNKAIEEAGIADIFKLKNLSIWTTWSNEKIIDHLKAFADTYARWNVDQITKANGSDIGDAIIEKQNLAVKRLKDNITYLSTNNEIFESFKLANTTMMIQMIIAKDVQFKKGRELSEFDANVLNTFDDLNFFENYVGSPEPTYRPFQLAFLLMNIEPTFNKNSNYRNDIVDLIWFPTGGGKTEAYLALTALTIIERRRHNNGEDTSGVSVMMRYTLRLLTAQQFERATYLICALEFLRTKLLNNNLGAQAITIGMWVGGSTTPNKFEDLKPSTNDRYRPFSEIFLNHGSVKVAKEKNKFPISYCSWCGCDLINENNTRLVTGFEKATEGQNISGLTVFCVNDSCHFSSKLPISFIDEDLYKKPPTLLFATVDKMVQLSHKKEAGNLFSAHLPIDLIIQDELHLLTGPLGSLTGLYELAIEQLCNREDRKPKIVASTATTRNTAAVIKAMYGRTLNVFPAQGVRFDDNFFSYLDPKAKRKHIGVMPTGKTAGLTEIKLVEALFEAKIKLLKCFLLANDIDVNEVNVLLEALNNDDFKGKIDPYWTFVFYYNNLRDLGRSKSRVSIDFTQQIQGMFKKQGFENIFMFVYNYLFSRTVEFTSRQESEKIKSLLNRTEQNVGFSSYLYNGKTQIAEQEGGIDLALASNMFSVGIDVNRLNLMLMVGQPGSVAEYIQASSRVARKDKGLVVNLLNPMRTRELSIFEDYKAFHASYYKNVEPLSITPFTQMAMDKLLNAVLVAYTLHVKGVTNVAGFNTQMKDDLIAIIINANRGLTYEQQDYLINKLNSLSAQWISKQQAGINLIVNNQNNNNGIFDLMNSLRDIDYDVYIENKSL